MIVELRVKEEISVGLIGGWEEYLIKQVNPLLRFFLKSQLKDNLFILLFAQKGKDKKQNVQGRSNISLHCTLNTHKYTPKQ